MSLFLFLFLFVHSVSLWASPQPFSFYESDATKIEAHLNTYIKTTIDATERWNRFERSFMHNNVYQDLYSKTQWIPQKSLTSKDIHFLDHTRLLVVPTYEPTNAQNFNELLNKRNILVGQISQEIMETCDTQSRNGIFYSTGTYTLTEKFLFCNQNVQLYVQAFSNVTVELNSKTTNIKGLVLSENFDETSMKNIENYYGEVAILGNKIPHWILEHVHTVKWHTLSFPEVTQISEREAQMLSQFTGRTLRLNGLKSINKRIASTISLFPQQPQNNTKYHVEIQGLQSIKPSVLSILTKNTRYKLHISLPNATTDHFEAIPKYSNIEIFDLPNIDVSMAQKLNDHRGDIFLHVSDISLHAYLTILGLEKDDLKSPQKVTWNDDIRFNVHSLTLTSDWMDFFEDFDAYEARQNRNRHHNKNKKTISKWISQIGSINTTQPTNILKAFENNSYIPEQVIRDLRVVNPSTTSFLLTKNTGLDLAHLQHIDTKSLEILVDSNIGFHIGLEELTPLEIQIISRRQENDNPQVINLRQLKYIDQEALDILLQLDFVKLPHWLTQQYDIVPKEWIQKDWSNTFFPNMSKEAFLQIDFSYSKNAMLSNVQNITPEHILHLQKFELQEIEFQAHALSPQSVQKLTEWPLDNRELEMTVKIEYASIDVLKGMEDMKLKKLSLENIKNPNTDISFLQNTKAQKLEIFDSQIDWNSLQNFSGHALDIQNREQTYIHYKDIIPLVQTFQGQSLAINNLTLDIELTKLLIQGAFDKILENVDLLEDQEEEILSLLAQKDQFDSKYTFRVEGLEICGLQEYRHIKSQYCEDVEDQLRSLEYWENHDCSEEEEEHEHE